MTVIIHRVQKKLSLYFCLTLCHMLTDIQNILSPTDVAVNL